MSLSAYNALCSLCVALLIFWLGLLLWVTKALEVFGSSPFLYTSLKPNLKVLHKKVQWRKSQNVGECSEKTEFWFFLKDLVCLYLVYIKVIWVGLRFMGCGGWDALLQSWWLGTWGQRVSVGSLLSPASCFQVSDCLLWAVWWRLVIRALSPAITLKSWVNLQRKWPVSIPIPSLFWCVCHVCIAKGQMSRVDV